MTREAADRVRESGPGERRKIADTMAEFVDASAILLRESASLRGAFARVHSEFLKYPECGDTIRQAISAYKNYVSADLGEGPGEAREKESPTQ